MKWIAEVLYLVVFLYIVVLFVRLVFSWIQAFSRDWRPRGIALVVAEAVFTVTDPPLNAVRRVIPPIRLGPVAIDIGFMVVMLACWLLLSVLGVLAR